MSDPIILDLTGAGFPLTNLANGVKFDFFNKGKPVQLSWTQYGSDAGWLALDRNGDGLITSGAELFGNYTPQPNPWPMAPNGFRALALYDLPANGGNGDGVISSKDAVWPKLRVWVDKNHSGITDPGELITMQQAGIVSISVHYDDARWTDEYGNQFRNRSKITFSGGKDKNDRYAYDVTLLSQK